MSESRFSFPDPLQREFVPCTRIVAGEKVLHAEILPGSRITRSFIGSDFSVCTVEPGGFLLLDFGQELSGAVRIVTPGTAKRARIRLRFGESCSEAMSEPNQDHAIHDAELVIPPLSSTDFGNTGFRFVRLDATDQPLALHNVIAICEYRHYPQTGNFRSSDALLNQVYDTCIRTIQLNMQDYLFDGVKRDRLVWVGDVNPEAMVILRAFGDVPVLRETLAFVREHTPQGSFVNGISSYTLWYFLTLYDLWFHTGDGTLLRENRAYMEYEAGRLASLVDGDGGEKLPPMRFLDWPTYDRPGIVHAGLQALLLQALRVITDMLKAAGSAVTVPEELLQKLRQHVPDPQECKAAAALQHLTGMADRRDVLEKDPFAGVSTYFGYYLLLAKANQPALDLIRNYWGAMLRLGATSFWEDFDLAWTPGATRIDELPVPGRPDVHKDFGAFCYKGLRHSLCHGWAAGPAAWCSRRILGVEPLKPGFEKIAFHPDLCDLEFAEGAVPTPYGPVTVSLKRGREPEITLPGGVSMDM